MSRTDEVLSESPRAKAMLWRLMIVDDHPLMRQGMYDVLVNDPHFEIVAAVGDAAGAVAMAREQRPDLATIDLSLADGNGLELIKQLRVDCPSMKLLVVSVHDEELYAERALRAGANGYLQKSEPAERLVEAIRAVLGGGTALSAGMTERLVHQAVQSKSDNAATVRNLSDREFEVFQMIGSGLSTRDIAGRLSLSVKTVETHRENIKRKLNITNGVRLTRYAVAWVESPS